MTTTSELNLPHSAERAHWHETHVIQLPARAARLVPLATLPSGKVVRQDVSMNPDANKKHSMLEQWLILHDVHRPAT